MELILEISRELSKCPQCLSKDRSWKKTECPNVFHKCKCYNGFNCNVCRRCIYNKRYKHNNVCLLNDICFFHDKKITNTYLTILNEY